MTAIRRCPRVVLLALVVGTALAALLAVSQVRAQPNIPHDPAQGGGACTMCHTIGGPGIGETGGTGFAASHEGRTDDACTMCHHATGPTQPAIPHDPAQGGGACTMCHTIGGPGVGETGGTGLAASHEGRTDDACTLCHRATGAETPTPADTAAPTEAPTDTAAPTEAPTNTTAPTTVILPPSDGPLPSDESSSSDWLIVVGVAIVVFAILGSAGYLLAKKR